MTDDKASDSSSPRHKPRRDDGPASALDRRKAALKANMARRKEQARARAAQGMSGGEDDDSGTA